MASRETSCLNEFKRWYASLPTHKRYGNRPAKGIIAAALIVLERLRDDCKLEIGDHLAKGGAQIAGMGARSLQTILSRYGEARTLTSEGGRTNRGNNKPVRELLEMLKKAGIDKLSDERRDVKICEMQKWLVSQIDAYFQLKPIRLTFDKRRPARLIINDIIVAALERQQAGEVAQHLVGAKLALRFPDIKIDNFRVSAPDQQRGRTGDFQVGQTVFHVTVAPNLGHAQKCSHNLEEGLLVYLIVDQKNLKKALVYLEEAQIREKVAVESIESFVGQNLSEIAEFSETRCAATWMSLLEKYNTRVSEVETDASLQIEIPRSLRKSGQ